MKFQLFHNLFFSADDGAFSEVTEREDYDSQITLTDSEADMVVQHFGRQNIHVGSVSLNPSLASKPFLEHGTNKVLNLNLVYPKARKTELRIYIAKAKGFRPKAGQVWFMYIDSQSKNLVIGSYEKKIWNAIGQYDDSDADYQEEVASVTLPISGKVPTPKIKVQAVKGRNTYFRDPILATFLFRKQNFQCNVDAGHQTFIADRDGKPYLEAHHLIPISFQNKITVPLDDIDNLVGLCPNCHRGIHLGEASHKIMLLDEILRQRNQFHNFTKDAVKSFYNCI